MAWSPEMDKIHKEYVKTQPHASRNWRDTQRHTEEREEPKRQHTIKQTGKQVSKGHKSNKSIGRDLDEKIPNLISIHEWCYW